MTMQQIAPPAPAPHPYTPAWSLYVYDDRGYLTFAGRVVATASVATPAQEDRLITLFHRLTIRTSRRYH